MNILAANLWALHARAAAEVATERAASITSLILRRRYPKPVTFADLRECYIGMFDPGPELIGYPDRRDWHAALKEHASAIDEVYAVVDGREVRVAVLKGTMGIFEHVGETGPMWLGMGHDIGDLKDVADREGYWERPHEVRLELSRDELRMEGVV